MLATMVDFCLLQACREINAKAMQIKKVCYT